MKNISSLVVEACKKLFNVAIEPEITRTGEQFGDYTTNVAMQLAKNLNKKPREIAEQIAEYVREQLSHIERVEVAGPGFINFTLSDEALWGLIQARPTQAWQGKTVIAEYSDPNTFKELHAGHLYTSIVGYSIGALHEAAGATVHRVNFGADVGLPIAKAMWGIIRYLGGELPQKLDSVSKKDFPSWISGCYVQGHAAYEDDESSKLEIVGYNKKVYRIHSEDDRETPFAQIYWTVRQWSYDYFNEFYGRIGTPFEKYYPESVTAPIGLKTVQEQTEKGVFEESNGAIVFRGEQHGLHTRVFINSAGLPTYEAKDVGLIMAKWEDYKFDRSVVITGNDIVEYMKVVLKAVEQFMPDLVARTTHITHGQVKLAGGVKMSSRKGNVLKATDVLDAVYIANKRSGNDESTALAAIKYSFLQQRIGGDIIYDPEESVALEGNSGPYIQYAHARARSILRKAQKSSLLTPHSSLLEQAERTLLRKIGEYTEVVDRAVAELMPHHICTYLYELAQAFNSFYEHNRVINDEREAVRLKLVESYAETLKKGLSLLNISAPDKM